MNHPDAYFITWTTYGTWLPGDERGWRQWREGYRPPQPRLEAWCRDKLSGQPVLLTPPQRRAVESVCQEHAAHRDWMLYEVHARSNHVHLLVASPQPPAKVRDQFKANATRVLRRPPYNMDQPKLWTRGGDVTFINGADALEEVSWYIREGQDRH